MYAAAPDCPTTQVARYWIPRGWLGIELTVLHMRRAVRDSLRYSLLIDTARDIVGPAISPKGAGLNIRTWLAAHVRFVPDPIGLELIRSPVLLIQTVDCQGYAIGDCDDVAVLGAALGLAVGIPARFVLLAFRDPGLYEHVYTELLTSEGPVELDTTRPAQMPAGLRIARAATRSV